MWRFHFQGRSVRCGKISEVGRDKNYDAKLPTRHSGQGSQHASWRNIYRHTHFMHLDLPEKACTFLCGDVICRYWDWAKKVASLFPEYKPMIEGMKPFLGRMHAKVHVWYCQIIWVGHWMSEAALTLGEEQEQVFSKMSRYGSVTKHMGIANRRDHLTAAVLFWNDQKEKGMVNQLIKRRERALKQIEISNKQLESDISKYKLKIEQLPVLLGELRKAAKECKAGKEHLKDELPLQQAQNSLEGYNAHIKILQSRISRIATTSGQRIKFRKAITLMSKKRSKLIAFISANSKFKIQEDNLLTGHFPWQNLSGSQCRSNMTFHEKYQVVDNWMMFLRSREEVLQSEKEMRNYVKSLLEHTTLLENQIKQNDIFFSSTSTSKEMKIARQKNVIWSQEKENCISCWSRQFLNSRK
ncbi:uncharacterized protein LOC124209013 [Daphnia pulex]|uniref:uncharacterized protein LOC124209013 n=1 Tax=Daphnia pulex TaxID=6669 RepID=UPI001EE0D0D1|nr:uncharacterized protein LOC124209013 [Daphnia pulex]XP_046462840.1 uncharacterized protein LOC124209013 [Daphnia pulex]